MIFNPNEPDKDEEKPDYFSGHDLPDPEKRKKEKRVALRPEDPRYWEQEESEWEHLKPRRRTAFWAWLTAAAVIAALATGIYLRYFSPYIDEAVQYGYVDSVEKRGNLFKTYEGVLIPYKDLLDTTRLYKRDFIFTAANAQVAARLKEMEYDGRPVRVSYRMYHATLPWRGASRIIVTGVDSVDPRKILPPEYTPEVIPIHNKRHTAPADSAKQM